MPIPFVHLHVHSDYSLLDGAQSIKSIIKQAAKFEMPAVALTDHGSMAGAFDLMEQTQKLLKDKKNPYELKPIYGCEFYVTAGDYRDHEPTEINRERYHLILLAENYQGYVNMCHLSREAYLKGYYYKPRIDFPLLEKYHEGIICLSACLSGQLPRLLLRNRDEEAEALARKYRDLFGEKNYYIELQDHGLADQKLVNPRLIALAQKLGIGMVVTNDAHYLRKEDAAAQDLMVCIGTQTTINDPKRMKFETDEFYFKSSEEMALLFPELPEAMSNTVDIASRCNVELKYVNHYPDYPEPPSPERTEFEKDITEELLQSEYARMRKWKKTYETLTDEELHDDAILEIVRERHLRKLCHDGLMWRYQFDPDKDEITPDRKKILDRMNYEISVIKKMGFISYYLVVWDFLHYAASVGIPLGPGRGSGAGSIVAYLIGITHIDPLRYRLLFERFLNPERVSPPDFDIDLCERRRGEVIEYVRQKYGADRVVQIGTFGTLKAKQVVKDVARAMGRTFEEGNRFCKLIPAHPKMTLDIALNGDPPGIPDEKKLGFPPNEELKQLIESEEWCQQLWNYAKTLEGLNRNTSIHAAGVIIGDMEVANVAPIAKGAGDEPITQFPAHPCEELGLLKMDFLGLKTLTLIQDALDLIELNTGKKIIANDIPIDDKVTYDLINEGKTIAVFQLESGGMQDLCKKWHLTRLEDIIALIAIYRPGPMSFIPEFLARKDGRVPVEYEANGMEEILAETYGIMLYQEQIMEVAKKLAGFTLGGADLLRRAIGKKKLDVMTAQKVLFTEGCAKNNIPENKSNSIWEKILKFAGYGFNKSHSAAYGLLTYRTAWLKANYPAEFMAAVLTSEMNNAEKLSFYLKECRQMGIQILAPAINVCGKYFSVDGKDIRFGLAAIKSVGEGIVQNIIDARQQDGPFKDLQDFCERVDGVNARLLDALILSGAMDAFGKKRAQLLAVKETAIAQAAATRRDRSSGQLSLFDLMGTEDKATTALQYPKIRELELAEKLNHEKELLGFYLSGHPIDSARELVDTYQIDDLADLPELEAGTTFRTGAYLASVSKKISKKTMKQFAILQLESRESSLEVALFNREFEAALKDYPEVLEPRNVIFIEGEVQAPDEEDGPKRIKLNKVIPAEKAPELFCGQINVYIEEKDAVPEKLDQFAELCEKHHGAAQVLFCLNRENGDRIFLKNPILSVKTTPKFLEKVHELFGEQSLLLKGSRERPVARQRGNFRAFANTEE
ncbi:MAG: DNA polymerase III subunit alpha [Victivallales bacterium]|nr:DNA polymerase III subunit alpha [Victivallales bacterium]